MKQIKVMTFKQAVWYLKNKFKGKEVEVVDRYSIVGIPRPNPWTVCRGHCEGMGFYPSNDPSSWPPGTRPLGIPMEGEGVDDGWRFITCDKCNGTGRRIAGRLGYYLDLLYTYYYPFHYARWSVFEGRFEDQTFWDALKEFPEDFKRNLIRYAKNRRIIRSAFARGYYDSPSKRRG